VIDWIRTDEAQPAVDAAFRDTFGVTFADLAARGES
jgi:hypothetical protein